MAPKNIFTGKNFMYEAMVIGVSAGGLTALGKIIPALPADYPLAVIIVQHMLHEPDNFLVSHLDNISALPVTEARLREDIKAGHVYIAPSGYHLLVERNKSFGLSVDPPVNFAIPAIDVLFESAARAYREKLVGLVLTGANADGSKGLQLIKQYGGLTIVQDPDSAEANIMPQAAIKLVAVDHIVPLVELGLFCRNAFSCDEQNF